MITMTYEHKANDNWSVEFPDLNYSMYTKIQLPEEAGVPELCDAFINLLRSAGYNSNTIDRIENSFQDLDLIP